MEGSLLTGVFTGRDGAAGLRRGSAGTAIRVAVVLLAFYLGLPLLAGSGARAATSGTGTVALLVQSSGPLTAGVVSEISSHALSVSYVWPEIRALALTTTSAGASTLLADPYVALVETDGGGSAPDSGVAANGTAATYAVPLFTSATPLESWNLQMAQTAAPGYNGTGVTVALLDSGLPQNWDQFLPAGSVDTTYAAGFGSMGYGSYIDPVIPIVGNGGYYGLFPHGLAVSSVLVGFRSPLGPIDGSAPGAKILPIRVLNQFNFGYFSWFIVAFLYVAHLKESGAIPGPLVINFSIQSLGYSLILQEAIDYAISHGVLFTTIAGNFGPGFGSIAFPGSLPESITVGAAGWVGIGESPDWVLGPVPTGDPSQFFVDGFSGRGYLPDQVDVVAPGTYVFGEWAIGPGFSEGHEVAFPAFDNFIAGTSFACPHVAGIVARMLEKDPGLSQSQAEAILKGTALPIPDNPYGLSLSIGYVFPWDIFASGSGLVQGVDAVAATPAA